MTYLKNNFKNREIYADIFCSAFMILTICVTFFNALDKSLFFNDISEVHIPIRHFFGENIRQGHFPLWTNGIYLGFPIFAEGQAGILYPLNLLMFTFMDTWQAYNLSFVMHLCIASVSMFFLLRIFFNRAAGMIGGIIYSLSGIFIYHHFHLNMIQAYSLLPLVLYLLEKYLSEAKTVYGILCSLCLGCLFLAGHPQTSVNSVMFLGLYLVFRSIFMTSSRHAAGTFRIFLAVFLIFLCSLCLYFIQLLPAIELMKNSVRSGHLEQGEWMLNNIIPQIFLSFFFPEIFGSVGNDTAWLSRYGMLYLEVANFIGASAFILIVIALVQSRKKITVIFFILSCIYLILVLGELVPMNQILLKIPFVNKLRFPCRFSPFFVFSASFLAANGLNELISCQAEKIRWKTITIVSLLCAAAVAFGIFRTYGDFFTGMSENPDSTDIRLRSDILRDLVFRSSIIILSAFSIVLARTRFRNAGAGALLLLTIFDMADFAKRQVPFVDPEYWEQEPGTVKVIRNSMCPYKNPFENECPEKNNLFRAAFNTVPADYLKGGWLNDTEKYKMAASGLIYNLPLYYGMQAVDGISPLRPKDFLDLYKPMYSGQGTFGKLNGKYIVTERILSGNNLKKLMDGHLRVYEDSSVLPRAFIVHGAEEISDPEEMLSEMLKASVQDLRQKAYLFHMPEKFSPEILHNGEKSAVKMIEYGNDKVILHAEMAGNGFLVLLDRFYPGWVAYVDGRDVPIYKADYIFRAVPLHRGKYEVVFEYKPRSFARGFLISSGIFIVLIFLLIISTGKNAFCRKITAMTIFFRKTSIQHDLKHPDSAKAVIIGVFLLIIMVSVMSSTHAWINSFHVYGQ